MEYFSSSSLREAPLEQRGPKRGRPRSWENRHLEPERVDRARFIVQATRQRLDSWKEVAEHFGNKYNKATFYRMCDDNDKEFKPSARLVALIEAIGIAQPKAVKAPPCPSCLSWGKRVVHDAGDCHGLPVASVVVLHPGETVQHNGNGAEPATHKPKRERAPRKPIEVTPETHGKHALLKEARQTWNDLEDELADVAAQLDAARLPGENRVDCVRRLTDATHATQSSH